MPVRGTDAVDGHKRYHAHGAEIMLEQATVVFVDVHEQDPEVEH